MIKPVDEKAGDSECRGCDRRRVAGLNRIAARKPDGRMNGGANERESAVGRPGSFFPDEVAGAAKKIFFSVFLFL